MATIDSLRRQPDTFDYSQSSQFQVTLGNFPLAQYFCTGVNLPGVSIAGVPVPTRLADIAMVGDKMEFEDFTMTFIVDENLLNYQEIFDWMVSIAFPESHAQFKAQERADGVDLTGDRKLYSDIALTVLSNKNNPVVRVSLKDAWPNALSGLEFSVQETDAVYLTASATFSYSYFDFTQA